MLEKIASWLSAAMILALIPLAMTRNEVLMALFLILFTVAMGCWVVVWHREYTTGCKKKLGKNPLKPQSEPEQAKPDLRPCKPTADPQEENKPLADIRRAEGCVKVWLGEEPHTFLLCHEQPDGTLAHRLQVSTSPRMYTRSGLMFILHVQGWPRWALEELARTPALSRITRDEAAPDGEGRVFWVNTGDLSRRYECLWFEKQEDCWQLICDAPGTLKERFTLPDATEEDIAAYLNLSPREFWIHPAIDKRISKPRKETAPKPKVNEDEMVNHMLRKLDAALAAESMDRKTLLRNLPGFGDPQFCYSAENGWWLLMIPDRQNPHVICRSDNEDAFCALVVEEARKIKRRWAAQKAADKRYQAHHVMNDNEQALCQRMLTQLDGLLKDMGADRSFIKAHHYGIGEPRFGYKEGQGYYYVVQPERSMEIVPVVIPDEKAFLAHLLREAAEYQDHDPAQDMLLALKHAWGGKAEHGEERLVLLRRQDHHELHLFSWDYDDANASTLTGVTHRYIASVNAAAGLRWRPSGILHRMQVMRQLPPWVVAGLLREEAFRGLFLKGYREEKPGQVYWFNGGDEQEHWAVWFEKKENVWQACSDIRRPDLRTNKATPLPKATDRDICELLALDKEIFLENPGIDKWYRQDPLAEVTLYEAAAAPEHDEESRVRYAIDTRCGALYCYEDSMIHSPRDARSSRRPASYDELARHDARYTGMDVRNWRQYVASPEDGLRAWQAQRQQTREQIAQARATFSEKEQKAFDAQLYQYTQDTGRDGRTPEDAAAIRGLTFVNGIPVPEKVARRMQSSRGMTVYRHERTSFYDREASVQLGEKSVLVAWNDPHCSDHAVYELPPAMWMTGFTRGELLTWLKAQGCTITFGEADLQDPEVLVPQAQMVMMEQLPGACYGSRRKIIKVHFATGSNSQHIIALYQKGEDTWLLSQNCWRDEHDPSGDVHADMAIRDENGSFLRRAEQALIKRAERAVSPLAAYMFSDARVYHMRLDPAAFGPVEREVYDWRSSVGHDSQSWDCRLHTATLHRHGTKLQVVEQLLYIDGTTQEEKWVTTVATLRKTDATNEQIMKAIDTLPCRGMESSI